MNTNDNKKFWSSARTYVSFGAGTSIKNVMAMTNILLRKHGVDPDMFVKDLSFDCQVCPPGDFDTFLGFNINDCFSPANTVMAAFPTDQESLELARQQGITSGKPDSWSLDPGSHKTMLGLQLTP